MIGYLTPNYPLVAAFRSLPLHRTRASSRASQRIFKMAPKLSDYFPPGDLLASKGDAANRAAHMTDFRVMRLV